MAPGPGRASRVAVSTLAIKTTSACDEVAHRAGDDRPGGRAGIDRVEVARAVDDLEVDGVARVRATSAPVALIATGMRTVGAAVDDDLAHRQCVAARRAMRQRSNGAPRRAAAQRRGDRAAFQVGLGGSAQIEDPGERDGATDRDIGGARGGLAGQLQGELAAGGEAEDEHVAQVESRIRARNQVAHRDHLVDERSRSRAARGRHSGTPSSRSRLPARSARHTPGRGARGRSRRATSRLAARRSRDAPGPGGSRRSANQGGSGAIGDASVRAAFAGTSSASLRHRRAAVKPRHAVVAGRSSLVDRAPCRRTSSSAATPSSAP
jgi:hypothetical protein